MLQRIVPLVILACFLCRGAEVRAQLTPEEFKQYSGLLAEPDAAPAYEKRLKLIAAALERDGDPKRPRSTTTHVIDLKGARVPAADGVPFLLKYFDHEHHAVKAHALRMLAAYGKEAGAALPRLRQAMSAETGNIREGVILTLPSIAPGNAEIAADVLAILGPADSGDFAKDSMNRAVLKALIDMAAVVPKSAIPQIAKFLGHRWTQVGITTHELIGKIIALERPTLEQLRKLEVIDWRGTPDQAYAVFAAIAEHGPKADFVAPLMVELVLSAPPAYLECVALNALGKIKTGHPRLISALLDRLVAKDPHVRNAAKMALTKVDLKEPASVRALANGLRNADKGVRYEAAIHLGTWDRMGKLAPAAHEEMLGPLLEVLGAANAKMVPGHLDLNLSLLRRFGTRAAPAAEALVKIYNAEAYFAKQPAPFGAHLRAKVLAALANIGVPETGRPLVLAALDKGPDTADSGHGYAAALRALGTFAQPKEAVPLLLPALKSTGPQREMYFIDWSGPGLGRATTPRLEAVRTLGKFAAHGAEALPRLKEIFEAEPKAPVDILLQDEARRVFQAIVKESGAKHEPLLFVGGKKDLLHLDDRLQVKMTMKLRNPRPKDFLDRLHKATQVSFSLDAGVDPARPLLASAGWDKTSAWEVMRRLASSTQGRWEQDGAGYRLAGPSTPRPTAKGTFPPFRDDTDDPMPNDPRLKVSLTIQLERPTIPDILQVLHKATGVSFAMENIDTQAPVFAGVNWSNTSAWMALRNIAEAPGVEGAWEKVGDGYRLRGQQVPTLQPPAVSTPRPAPAGVAAVAEASSSASPRWSLLLALAAFLVIVTCFVLAWLARKNMSSP